MSKRKDTNEEVIAATVLILMTMILVILWIHSLTRMTLIMKQYPMFQRDVKGGGILQQ